MKEEKKKTDSRKFIAWITWLAILIVAFVITLSVIVITKNVPTQVMDFVMAIIQYFFWVTMLYLGANVGQKVGLAFADIKKEEKENEEAENAQ